MCACIDSMPVVAPQHPVPSLPSVLTRPSPPPRPPLELQERLRQYGKKVRKVLAEKELKESKRSLEVSPGGVLRCAELSWRRAVLCCALLSERAGA